MKKEEEEGKEKVKAEGPRCREVATSHPAPVAIPTGLWLSALRTGSRDVPCWCFGRAGVQTKSAHQNRPTNTTAHVPTAREISITWSGHLRQQELVSTWQSRSRLHRDPSTAHSEKSRIVPASLRHGLLDCQNKMAGREAQQAQAAAKEFLFKVLVVGGTTPRFFISHRSS